MIEVIKHGQKKFKATCTNCGCEFTYEMLRQRKPLHSVHTRISFKLCAY